MDYSAIASIESIHGFLALVFAMWGIPLYVIAKDMDVLYHEKIFWLFAVVIFSWLAFVFFLINAAFRQQHD